MPSPTSTTVPTERDSTPVSNSSMADLMIWVMSSERMAMGRPTSWAAASGGGFGEAGAQPLQAAADGTVEEAVAKADLEPADEAGVDALTELDASSGHGCK